MIHQWLWTGKSRLAALARASLVPPALLYRGATALRAAAYERAALPRFLAARPVISVGNREVGGTGKTPIASWIAHWYAAQGLQPGIVLRGYGADESEVHRLLVPGALIGESPDRAKAIREVCGAGADVVVLDDGFQRMDVHRDLDLVLVSADSAGSSHWTLPAGPWREGPGALDRADMVIVTRKASSREDADTLAEELERAGHRTAVAALAVERFGPLDAPGAAVPVDGGSALVVSGIGNGPAFAVQCRQAGLKAREMIFADHYRYQQRDVQTILQAARGLDHIVTTAKDAVKLNRIWPKDVPMPLVAHLTVRWERNGEGMEQHLTHAARLGTPGESE